MYLLKKGTFEFERISESGYKIDEQPNLIAKKQFVNGNRKKIVTNYTDVVIEIKISMVNANEINNYINNFIDGEYEFYSIKDRIYKSANFVVTFPELVLRQGLNIDDLYFENFTVLLEKSSDIEVHSI